MKPNIHVITGKGPGKTTSAFGVALRMLGHNKKVLVLQFMKGRKNIGEYKIKNVLKNFEIKQFGRKDFVNLKKPSKVDKELAMKGLEYVKRIKDWPDLLVLDEICLAAAIGLVKTDDVIQILKSIPKKTQVYLTGRYAPLKLQKFADFVTVVQAKKMCDDRFNMKGITY